jgi:hypothetical protein
MTEEFLITPENKMSVVLKTNADIIKYLSLTPSMIEKDKVDIIKLHSAFILEASEKVLMGERLNIKSVK